ncbi:hypothetical protein EYF80_023346 [Liparis tanakae]|uniref:Uncharacterized protein n=1 Tax=Liparis tanakae TaxID=230148 RepID=A0A4Z2HKR7_9TELE|nr:hypothetical protein EYF80_023346 [Liparis tanakae]
MKENSLVLYSIRSSAILLRWVKHNEAQNKNSAKETHEQTRGREREFTWSSPCKIWFISSVVTSLAFSRAFT